MSDFPIIQGPDGKPVFVGKEDPHNPPVEPQAGNKMECPVCHGEFDYLLGEDVNGGRVGCEKDYRKPQEGGNTHGGRTTEGYDTSKEILAD